MLGIEELRTITDIVNRNVFVPTVGGREEVTMVSSLRHVEKL
jgi:hypothetical protein